MGNDSVTNAADPLQPGRSEWIETFRRRSWSDLQSGWRRCGRSQEPPFIEDSWGQEHRPDWAARGLLIWPRGRQWLRLEQWLRWPQRWRPAESSRGRLALSWWAESMRLWVNGVLVHEGDLFDTACRWVIPDCCRQGASLHLQLELCSPCHDDGALISSALHLEPMQTDRDPDGALIPERLLLHLEAGGALPDGWQHADPSGREALVAVQDQLRHALPPAGAMHWVGHAHLDLAWLWPVADTWQAAERTFRSALSLMETDPALHFAHSTPALYAWLERHRPALFQAVQAASRAGRWEPVNGPWVETDCVLVSSASLWRQFQLGQALSYALFPEWRHELAWLPDSFGFSAALPAVASRNGVRWFCTHKLAWNADNPFPHRLFRWRSRGGGELLALMLPPIGRRCDPLEMLQEQRSWRAATGVESALWIPGVGDHGGGPTQEMLEQMQLWDVVPEALPRQSGSVRQFLEGLEPLAGQLPVWRDELYLELHRGCATTRPDQKRHNRTLERLLREADVTAALLALRGVRAQVPDWRPLLFQQFHDILPGTSIPDVFEQAEPIWRRSRRDAVVLRDRQIRQLLSVGDPDEDPAADAWAWIGLQPLARWSSLLRLPFGSWHAEGQSMAQQSAAGGGVWVQPPPQQGLTALALQRKPHASATVPCARNPVCIEPMAGGGWRIGNRQLELDVTSLGLIQCRDGKGCNQLAGPLQIRRFRDRGEFWDAWDLPADYRDHPLDVSAPLSVQLLESGPLLAHVVLRYCFGSSAMRLDLRLQADCPWFELICSIHWRQRHELLRLELPLACPSARYAADTSGGVLERPAAPLTRREQSRWEVPVISWFAAQYRAPGGGLALLLDGPQGVDGVVDRMGVSLLRGPTWPDPAADQGWHRQRLAVMPFEQNWSLAAVPQTAIAFREPGWCQPVSGATTMKLLPGLPPRLVPLAVDVAEHGVIVRLLNPGAARCRWCPGGDWRLKRDGDQSELQQLTFQPGELVEVLLTQSS